MQFNSFIFLFLFLPLALLVPNAMNRRLRNLLLLLFSLAFYAWNGVSITLVLLCSIVFNYISGLLIQASAGRTAARVLLITTVVLNILMLAYYKFLAFSISDILVMFGVNGSSPFVIHRIVIPLGISFFTFSNISYLIDIFRSESPAEKNIIRFALFVSFFPRIIAGPIWRYKDARGQLMERKITLEGFASGIERFIIGLAKKVLIADTFALVAGKAFSLHQGELTFCSAWIGIICYSLQIYVDFSGYTDMAVGMGRMFGFTIPENFNLPYIAQSIREFWQRWHITLSTWLRDYLFTPLSLSLRGIRKWGIAISVLVTFAICGLWHDAGWNFILWGLFHGIFITVESLGLGKLLQRCWRPLRHLYFILIIVFSWVLFRSNDPEHALDYFGAMLGFSGFAIIQDDFLQFNNSFILCLVLAVLGSAGVFINAGNYFKKLSMRFSPAWKGISVLPISLVEMALLLSVFVISLTYMAINNYNPFLYFRF